MAHVTTSLRAQDPPENVDQETEKLQSKRSSLRLSGLLNRRKSQRVEADKPEDSEKPVKRDLQVPLYRRYASFRSRTPSARGGSTTPKSVGKDGMASTAEVDTKNLPEGTGVKQTESADQSKKPETAFPTSSDSKVEKPLPEPKDVPSRPRRLSVKVSKILSALPGKTKEKVESDSHGAEEGSGRRRLLVKVGNIVNRKPKVTPEPVAKPEVKVEGKGEDEAKEVVATEDKDAPPVPAKAEDGITEERREEAKPIEEVKTEAPPPAAKPSKASPPSAANRATKLARRLSAGALDAVFRTKAKAHAKGAEGEAPPVSKASLAAQDIASQPAESKQPTVEEAKSNPDATTAPESSDDKALPPPPADDSKASKTKEKAPPSAFKDAAKVARRLSTGLFKKPNASSPDLHSSDAKADESTAAESKSVVETSSTAERATELVRKVSRRAQDAVAKARAKVKVEGKHKTAAPAPETAPPPPAPEEKPTAPEDSAPAPPAEPTAETKEEAPATEKAKGIPVGGSDETKKGSEEPAAAQEGDKELPPPPSSFSLGGLTRRLSGSVSGVFGYGATAEATAPPTEQAATDSSAPSNGDKPTEVEPTPAADTKEEPSSEGATATPAPAPEPAEVVGSDATPEAAALKKEEAAHAPPQEPAEPAPEESPVVDKALPSPPPPSAVESIAKIGKLTRRLSKGVSTRVGSAIRSATSHSKDESHPGEDEKQAESEGPSTKEKVDGAPSTEEVKPGEGTDASAVAAPKEPEAISPTAVDAETSTPSPATLAPAPPGAFKASRTKLGRRLSARIGDVFRSKAPPVPEKEAAKDSDTKPVSGEVVEVKAEPEDASKAPAAEDTGSKEEGEKKADVEAKEEPTPVAVEGEAVKSEETTPAVAEAPQPEAPSADEATKAEAEATPDKPLPSKPSRSTRAKDVAVDVGRQLSIKATGALKAARPKLEEIVARAPSAFKSSDKGKEREKVDGEESDGGAQADGLGKRISKRVVDGIRGLNHKQGASGSDTKAVKDGGPDEDWEEVEAESAAVASKPKSPAETPNKSGEPTSTDDVKGASVEAVEGAPTPITKDAPKAEQLKEEEAKSGRPLSSLVTGIFKPKHKSELPLLPTEATHAHDGENSESKGGTTKGKDEKRRRRISLGFGTKRKGKKGADAKGEVKVDSGSATSLPPPAVPPKDAEGEAKPALEAPEGSAEEKSVPETSEISGEEKRTPVAEVPESSIDEKVQSTEVEATTRSA